MKSSSLSRLLFAIAAAAPASAVLSVACGGATVTDLTSNRDGASSGSTGASSGSTSGGGTSRDDKGASSGTSGSSGASSGTSGTSGGASSGTSGCSPVPPRTFKATYSGVLCTDAGPADLPCESEEIACRRTCEGQLSFSEHFGSCSFEADKKTIVCETMGMPCGRAHDGLAPLSSVGATHDSPVARWLEEAAYLEDASVTSFEILARELSAHGAPAHLVRAARKSARDEVRHARLMSALAQRHGGRATRSDRGARERATRSPEAMLLENAIEGCVHETYGALVAWYQAANAADPKMRAAMAIIARDESEHAALAWQIAGWAESKLDDDARARVAAARQKARGELHEKIGVEPTPWVAAVLGLPSSRVARGMLGSLEAELSRAA